MPTFNYIARDSEGTRKDGTVDAADRNSALLLLQQMGCTPLSLTQTAGAKNSGSAKSKIKFTFSTNQKIRMKPRGMLLFTRELADLLSSGMTLGRALHTQAKRDSDSANATIIPRLRDEVVQGSSLSDALRIYPDSFPQLYVSMVRAGEASGALAEALQGLCFHYERVQEAKSKVVTALIYPAIVLLVGVLSVIGLMVFIVPKFSSIFDELGGTMPVPTQILMGISNGMIQYGWIDRARQKSLRETSLLGKLDVSFIYTPSIKILFLRFGGKVSDRSRPTNRDTRVHWRLFTVSS